jgi:hypothetical protein
VVCRLESDVVSRPVNQRIVLRGRRGFSSRHRGRHKGGLGSGGYRRPKNCGVSAGPNR